MTVITRATLTLVSVLAMAGLSAPAYAGGSHSGGHEGGQGMMESMRELHSTHEHGHDFEAMDEMSPEQAARMMQLMQDVGLALPPMDSSRGRAVFAEKGCVVCHSVNGVGVEIGPSLNASDMPAPMNAFEFAARMWRGAAAMSAMQEEAMGGVIDLTGQELADLVAFAHDAEEQKKLTQSQIPQRIQDLMAE